MPPGVGDLYATASEFLAACETAVATTDAGAIPRSYVSPGLPSIDCPPEISVYVGGPMEGPTSPVSPPLVVGERSDETGKVNLIRMTCVVSRCTPTVDSQGNFPSPAAIEAAAKEVLDDLWAIWNVLPALYRAGTLFTRDDGEQRLLFFDPAASLDPSGGAGGSQVPIRVELSGYRPVVAP